MDAIPVWVLLGILILMLALSAFFSGSETGLMSLNPYRMKNLARNGHGGARRAAEMLETPDRLIGLILLGNNLVNIIASALATVIGIRLLGDFGIVVSTVVLTIAVLICSEVTPKTLSALYPEQIAYPAAYVYKPLLRVFWPLVYLFNSAGRAILWVLRLSPEGADKQSLSSEELRTVVTEADAMIPQRYQQMLVSILDMENATIEDIMVPRNEMVGIDINAPWHEIRPQLVNNQHTRLPLYDGSIDDIKGLVHMRRLLALELNGELDRNTLLALADPPYFIPENTPLNQQLLNFQAQKTRIGFVVDEYGDIQGLATLEDILEEIVGEFTTDPLTRTKSVTADGQDRYQVNGSVAIRSLNRVLGWQLPADGPRTINGLITEQAGRIPKAGTRLHINGYVFEILETQQNLIQSVRIQPATSAAHEPAPETPDTRQS